MTTAGVLAPDSSCVSCGFRATGRATNSDGSYSMDSSSPALLKLRVENRKRNVFVTQLEEHREQSDEQIKHIPVITESSSGVLLTGVQTLQSTLVLQKRGEVQALEEQLKETRQEVQENMRVLQRRRAQLQQRQTETKHRAAKFEKFVEENEVKRRRALKKFQMERQQKEVKEKEKEELSKQLQDLQARRLYLQERVNKYKKFEEFLLKTLDLLPDKYLGFGTDLVTPIIRRYETLSFSRQDLLEQLSQLMEKIKTSQSHLEASRQQHSTFRLMMNQELSEWQTQLDQLKEKNKQLEMTLHLHLGQSRDQVEELGSILITVKSLADQCHLGHYGALDVMDTHTMMDMIKEFITEKADLERRAMRLMDSSAGTVKRTTPKKKKSGSTLQTLPHTSRASN